MHLTVGQKKLLTHIKRKRFYINSSHYRVQIRCFTTDLFLN